MRSERYQEARDVLDRSWVPAANDRAPLDCLGLALALITRSPVRLAFWGEKVRVAAQTFPAASRMLEQLAEAGSKPEFQLQDFPEVQQAVSANCPKGGSSSRLRSSCSTWERGQGRSVSGKST